jgi:hypothetical protein
MAGVQNNPLTMTAKHIHIITRTPKPVPEIIIYANKVADAFDPNEYVTHPTLDVATFRANIALLVTAQAHVKTLGAGQRDDALKVVLDNLDLYRHDCEVVVNANPAKADTIAAACVMAVEAKHGPSPRGDVHICSTGTPGEVKVLLKAADKPAAYEIKYSIDDGKTYITLAPSPLASFTISGLPLGVKLLVCARLTIGHVTGPWSDPVSFIVH